MASTSTTRRLNRLRTQILPTVLKHGFLLTVTAAILIPFSWVILMSFRPYYDLTRPPVTIIPRIWTLDNWRALFNADIPLLRYCLNSVVVAFTVVPATVIMSCLAGYGFARLEFPGRDTIFWAFVSTIFLPLLFPRLFTVFEMTYHMKLMDTRLGLILPYLSLGLMTYTFIMRNVFKGVPNELEAAARIDGCSRFGVFWRVMLPLSTAGLMMVTVLCFLLIWGEFLYAATLTYAKALTLPVALAVATSETQGDTVMTTLATAYTLAMILPIVVYIGLNRWFRAGFAGALKF